MQRLSPKNQRSRFQGGAKHFHHSKARRSSWDQWVDGGAPPPSSLNKWLKILGLITVCAALGSLIAGFILVLQHS